MRFDNKIKKLIRQHGVAGYGVYNYILENIAFQLRPENPIPDIEEDAHDIAQELAMDTLDVEKIIKTCIDLNLFQINSETKRLMCLKMLCHLDITMSNNPEIKKILGNFKKLLETNSSYKQIRLDKTRSDKTRSDKIYIPKTLDEVKEYAHGKGYADDLAIRFWDYFTEGNWVDSKGNKVRNWKQKFMTWAQHEKPPEKSAYEKLREAK